MKNMPKKGISPLIATVLIIGFTVALAAVILTWGTSFTKSISKGTEETADIQLTCAQDVQFDVKAACIDRTTNPLVPSVKFIVENNGNKNIQNFTARLKVTETEVLTGVTTEVNRFGIKTYTALSALPLRGDDSFVVSGLLDSLGAMKPIMEVTLVPVISMAGKEVTCPNSIDSYSPPVEGTALSDCE